MDATIRKSFEYCERLARAHYENFPVASRLIPRAKRPYVAAVYAFARTADDFADEGNLPPFERLERLNQWEHKLDSCFKGVADDPIFIALAETVARHNIPRAPLAALIEAFRMDVTRRRYEDYAALLHYCTHSANPVGQLVLYLFDAANSETIPLSDNICTGLQLANFWQDVSVDRTRGRIYIPLEDFDRFGYTEHDFGRGIADERFRNLMKFEVDRTRELFHAGESLIHEVGPGLRLELNLTIMGGKKILERIERTGYNVLSQRPVLTLRDKLALLARAAARTTLWKPRLLQ